MYVGPLSDFFYKPKDFLINMPKYKQRHEFTYLNVSNRIFRINNITGNIKLITNYKHYNLTTNKKIKLSKFRYINSRNSENVYFTMNNTSRTNETRINGYSNKTLNNTSSKRNKIKNSKKTFKNKIKKISQLDLINAYKTSTFIRAPKVKSIKYVEETFKKNIFPYYTKSPKKYIKPNIIFGQKFNNDTIPINKTPKKKLLEQKNSFLTIYKQHFNNLTNDGNNDRIYFENKNDNFIMKAFKEQILKEKVEKELKNKFKFYNGGKDHVLKIPNLSPKNFEFYDRYSISDTKREGNNYHKLFFRYVNKHKFEESQEKSTQHENNI